MTTHQTDQIEGLSHRLAEKNLTPERLISAALTLGLAGLIHLLLGPAQRLQAIWEALGFIGEEHTSFGNLVSAIDDWIKDASSIEDVRRANDELQGHAKEILARLHRARFIVEPEDDEECYDLEEDGEDSEHFQNEQEIREILAVDAGLIVPTEAAKAEVRLSTRPPRLSRVKKQTKAWRTRSISPLSWSRL